MSFLFPLSRKKGVSNSYSRRRYAMTNRDLNHPGEIRISPEDALIVVDMQNDFMPGGALSVPEGDEIVPGVNVMMQRFSDSNLPLVLTQDWHPRGHRSFASAHAAKKPFDLHEEPGIGPVLWPDHCVQGSRGADFHRDLSTHYAQAIIRKGYCLSVDSYSGFLENDRATPTGLDGYLRARGVKRIFICGLALDYCVFFTACDAVDLGYGVVFLIDLTKPVGSPPDSVHRALETLQSRNVPLTRSEAVIG
jgi:nicotinamidase/pyrazinamidase